MEHELISTLIMLVVCIVGVGIFFQLGRMQRNAKDLHKRLDELENKTFFLEGTRK